jgi:hypothetical protein
MPVFNDLAKKLEFLMLANYTMHNRLVILTYPGHFLMTLLTIKSYLAYHPAPEEIIVVADDVSSQSWPTYIRDCEELYAPYSARVIASSSSTVAKHFAHNDWIRQQIIKLHLDLLIGRDSWFFTDGDIIFLNSVTPGTIPYTMLYESNPAITQQQNNYVCTMLGIDQPGLVVNGQQVCVSNPPFRYLSSQLLQDLRSWVETKSGRQFYQTHEPFQHADSISVSEWELIENFRCYIMQQQPSLVQYAPHTVGPGCPPVGDLNFFKHQFITCYCSDSELGRAWLESHGAAVSDHHWNLVEQIVRL